MTPLERAILERYHEADSVDGFPAPDQIRVTARDHSGAGGFVDLDAPLTSIGVHACALPHDVNVEMDGLNHGIGFVPFIDQGRLDMLELFTHEEDWDGEERPWRFVNVAADPGIANA